MQFLGDSRIIGRSADSCLCACVPEDLRLLWSCNVLGSHAWPISRTYQIVAHWCNSWKSQHIDAILGWQSHHWSVGGFLWLLPEVAPPDRWSPFKENLLWTSISFVYYRESCGGQTIQMCHSFRGMIGHEKANDERNRERISLSRPCVIVMWMSIVYQNSQETMF